MGRKVFLSAEWRKLLMVNYIVDPQILKPYLPCKTELDDYNGRHYVSLVGFMFLNTRIMGVKIPFHINFPEVNLRFYVKYKENGQWKRGVVFVSEIVPRPAIAWVANTFFNEHYSYLPVRYEERNEKGLLKLSYRWKSKNKWNSIHSEAGVKLLPILKDSEEEFIYEHYYGYSHAGKTKTNEYLVEHPQWDIHPVKSYKVDCDFEDLYGKQFAGLTVEKPCSVFLAGGSEVKVYNKRTI